MIKLLGLFDFIASVLIILFQYHLVPFNIMLSPAAYLLMKSIIFLGDWPSILDGIIAIYIIVMIFYSIEILSIIFAIHLFIKAAVSWM